MFSRRLQNESAIDILPELFAGFPAEYITVTMEGEPKVDKEKGRFIVPVRVELDVAKTKVFIKQLDGFFNTATDQKPGIIRAKVDKYKDSINCIWRHDKSRVYLMTSLNSARTNAIIKHYPVNAGILSFFKKTFSKKPYISIDLVDGDDDPIMGKNVSIPTPFRLLSNVSGEALVVVPVLTIESGTSGNLEPGKEPVSYSISSFDVSPDEVAEIKNVTMQVMMD